MKNLNLLTLNVDVNSGEKSDVLKHQAAEKIKADSAAQEIIRRDTAILHNAASKRLARATASEFIRKGAFPVVRVVTIGNVVPHHKVENVYVVTMAVTHKYVGTKKGFRVQPLPKITYAFNRVTGKAHPFGQPEEQEETMLKMYGAPLARKYFERQEALMSADMETLPTLRPYNMMTLPEFKEFLIAYSGKQNPTEKELGELANDIAEKNLPDA